MLDAFWIVFTGILVVIPCAVLGCFLLLRKMSMLGDAISHAVLPGLVLAYIISQSRASNILLIGAGFSGVLVTYLIELLRKKAKMSNDSSIGLSFTFLFAIGIILISAFTGKIDLDQDCVLFGEIAYIPLNTSLLKIPSAIWSLGIWCIFLLLLVYIAYKPLWISSFDENYALSIGISTVFWHYSLMSAVSFSTVFSFEAVGAVLVVAFLVVPPATAYLLTESLPTMLFLSVIFAIVAVFGGYAVAVALNTSLAGTMATVVGVEFFLAFAYTRLKMRFQAV
jgi:manganese/zinc/iron transport system permease protein